MDPSSLTVPEGAGEQSVCLSLSNIDDKADINVVIAINVSDATTDMATGTLWEREGGREGGRKGGRERGREGGRGRGRES